jgi:hypothetical protein
LTAFPRLCTQPGSSASKRDVFFSFAFSASVRYKSCPCPAIRQPSAKRSRFARVKHLISSARP